MAPTSQKDRPISFALDDGRGGLSVSVLVIRPEDLVKNDPSLLTATPTMDGAFIDDFGPGLSTIQISGHTGWGAGNRPDGAQAFADLYNQVWKGWHQKRQQAVRDGLSPKNVKLIFADRLDDIVCVVAPGAFMLKRSRSRPLLSMYQINMTVISNRLSEPEQDLLNFDAGDIIGPAGVRSMQASVNTLQAQQGLLHNFVSADILNPVSGFVGQASGIMSQVLSVVNESRGVAPSSATHLISLASDVAEGGRNLFNTLGAAGDLSPDVTCNLASVASAFENCMCVLRNVFAPTQLFPDYGGVYGASVCSSTVGGSPVSPMLGTNPFEAFLPISPITPAVTADARAGLDFLKALDPALRPVTGAAAAARLAPIAVGITF